MNGKKKLTLSTETLRLLDDDDLVQVAGGDKGGFVGFTGNGPNGCQFTGNFKTLTGGTGTTFTQTCVATTCLLTCPR